MKVFILFSGGKDSCLTAIMLSKFFEIELVTANFGILSNWEKAEKVAKKLNFPFRILKLDKKILEDATEQTVRDSFPNNGIKYIHQKTLEEIAKNSKIIADGVRRDDRVPVLSMSEVRSFEDKFKVHYIQPLMGYSRKTINVLVEKFFFFEEYKSNSSFIGAEYEFELREIIRKKYGDKEIKKIFPQNHKHSLVIDVKNS